MLFLGNRNKSHFFLFNSQGKKGRMFLHFKIITAMLLLCSDRQLTIQETKYNNKIPRTPSELFSKYPKNLNIARGKKFNNPLSCMNNYNFPFKQALYT